MKRTSATLAVVGLGLISVTGPASAAPNMVIVCHDGSDTGTGWNPMQFNVNGLNGHDGHPTDIIPPNNSIPGGLNWTNAGKITYIANCAPLPPGETPPVYPPVVVDPPVVVTPPVVVDPPVVVPPVVVVDPPVVVPPVVVVDPPVVVPPVSVVDPPVVVPPVSVVDPPVVVPPVVVVDPPAAIVEPPAAVVDPPAAIVNPPAGLIDPLAVVVDPPVVVSHPVVPNTPSTVTPPAAAVANAGQTPAPQVVAKAPAQAAAVSQGTNRGFNAQTAAGGSTPDSAPTWLGGLGVLVAAVMAIALRRRSNTVIPTVR